MRKEVVRVGRFWGKRLLRRSGSGERGCYGKAVLVKEVVEAMWFRGKRLLRRGGFRERGC